MKYLTVSNKKYSLKVSKLVLGSNDMPTNPEKPEMYSMLELFCDKGGNCIDTARLYNGGMSETSIGEWMKVKGNRDKIIISSKGAHPKKESMEVSRLDNQSLSLDLAESLQALQTDYIDIYWLHRDNELLPVEPIIDTLNAFIKDGKVKILGASNWSTKRIALANEYAKSTNQIGFSCSQIQWSLASTATEFYRDFGIINMTNEEYEWYKENQFPVFAFASQAGGFFHKLNKNMEISEKINERYNRPDNLARYESLVELANNKNTTLTAPLLSFITCNELPAVAILGCKNANQLKDSLNSDELELTYEECNNLYKIKNI